MVREFLFLKLKERSSTSNFKTFLALWIKPNSFWNDWFKNFIFFWASILSTKASKQSIYKNVYKYILVKLVILAYSLFLYWNHVK